MGRNIKSPLKPSGLEPGAEINIHQGGCHCAPAANGFRPGSIAKLKEEMTLSAARRASRSRDSRSWVHVLSTAIEKRGVSISSQVMLPILQMYTVPFGFGLNLLLTELSQCAEIVVLR